MCYPKQELGKGRCWMGHNGEVQHGKRMCTEHTVLCGIRMPCVQWAPRWIGHCCCLTWSHFPLQGSGPACLWEWPPAPEEELKGFGKISKSINIKLECALSPHHPPANHHRWSLVSYKFWGGSWVGDCPSRAGSSFCRLPKTSVVASPSSGRQNWD